MKTKSVTSIVLILLCLSISIILPAALYIRCFSNWADLAFIAFIYDLIIALLFIFSFLLLNRYGAGPLLFISLSIIAAVYYILITAYPLYWIVTSSQPDLFFILDSLNDIPFTISATIGGSIPLLIFCLIAFGLIAVHGLNGTAQILNQVLKLRTRIVLTTMILTIICLCVPLNPYRPVLKELARINLILEQRALIVPFFPDYSDLSTSSIENIFVLQLESGSSMAYGGHLSSEGKNYPPLSLPNLERIANDGVFTPYHWSNSIQSNRAILNLLCGINNNIDVSLSYDPAKIQSKCLPQILSHAGYQTLFYWAFVDPKFTNLKDTIEYIGFDKLYDAKIMPPEHHQITWGVDDCAFYNNAFEHLDKHHSTKERLFVYMKVSSHHYPFNGRAKYASQNEYENPLNLIEKYSNSALQQDYCLGEFYKNYQKRFSHNAHLFILYDHAWPLGMHGNFINERYSYNENFLVPFLYVPPTKKREKFMTKGILPLRFSYTDFTPTVIDLVSNQTHARSYASALRDGKMPSDFEDCYLLVQPYNGAELAIIRGNRKYRFEIIEKRVTEYDLKSDFEELEPLHVKSDISYNEFRNKYFCSYLK